MPRCGWPSVLIQSRDRDVVEHLGTGQDRGDLGRRLLAHDSAPRLSHSSGLRDGRERPACGLQLDRIASRTPTAATVIVPSLVVLHRDRAVVSRQAEWRSGRICEGHAGQRGE